MAAKLIGFVCIFAVFGNLNAQYLNRVVPGCGCGNNVLPMPLPVAETILPNQVVFGPKYGAPIVELPYGVDTILTNPIAAAPTTIIQDSTVANNLANALQLLVVSNLLSNTLPTLGDQVVVPAYNSPLEFINPVVSQIGSVVSPIGPVMSPINPIPINSCGCGCGPFSYIY